MWIYSSFYRRHLPHWQPPGAIFFITFNLYGALPKAVLDNLKSKALELRNKFSILDWESPELVVEWKKLYKYLDEELDTNQEALYLQIPNAALLVTDAIMKQHDEGHFILHRYCIMPNHVHLLVEPLPDMNEVPENGKQAQWPPLFYTEPGREILCARTNAELLQWRKLSKITKAIKGSTAHKIGKIVGRCGKIWHEESYDHWVRNGSEYERIIEYIDRNPVKAGLCKTPCDWEWGTVGSGNGLGMTQEGAGVDRPLAE